MAGTQMPLDIKFELQQMKVVIQHIALPPNKGMELTVRSVTPFAKRRAKGAPLRPAAHPKR